MTKKPTYEELQQRVRQLEKECNERKVTREELLKAKKLEAIAALSGGIAHDYNNLLTAIMGNISLAQTYIKPKDRLYGLLSEAHKASRIARDLTQKLITFSKGVAPIKKTASMSPLVRRATEFSLSGSNVRVEFSLLNTLWPVEIDKTQISQAIYNLVINASEAIAKYKKSVDDDRNHAIRIRTFKEDDQVVVTIFDTGSGVSKSNIPRIYEPFFTTKATGQGKGLGLTISNEIVRSYGGHIEVDSEEKKGTTFKVSFPCLIPEDSFGEI